MTYRSSLELKEVPMGMVEGLDVHRRQITFDCVDVVSDEEARG